MQDNILLERLPVVCTRGMILFPDQDLIFDVGREKSINAIKDAEENFDGRVFLVSQQDLLVEYPLKDDLYEVGVIAEIKNIRKQDGFYRVKFRGQDRAVIREFMDADDAYYGLIERLSDIVGDPKEELVLVRKVMKRFEELQAHDTSLSKENLQMITAGIAAGQVADQFASILPMAFERRQELLETLDINERLLMIITEMENEKQLEVIESRIDEKVKDRIEENQKEYYLREKLRAIKEELGDIPDQNQDIEALREKVKNNPYPENIKNRALEEIQRYELLPNASSESGVVKTYLDWLINLPWWEESKDQEDLEAAKNILDDEHFGLEKVKQRILEYLAVKQMSKTLNAPIICLVGPPGVGKTSLAKSVAHALERKFVKISLGGVKDESEIRGHRRTYLGSLPGRFIQSMKKAGTINPVFLIDEIDKMASDYKGDPASAMLEVLDPEQNSMFSDHYLEEPYDLSKVLFIATANYIQDIPEALRDRLEIIELTSYTELEKVQIANKHLVSKQIKVNGLKNSQFKIDEDMLLYLIRYYTRESGVRQLERTIAT
ncbi:MAG: endopeptidase La, partial [Erysipelotrichaceae bacterium]